MNFYLLTYHTNWLLKSTETKRRRPLRVFYEIIRLHQFVTKKNFCKLKSISRFNCTNKVSSTH